jgi:hypothetical protein
MKTHASSKCKWMLVSTILTLAEFISGCGIPTVSPMIRVGELDIDGDFNITGGGGALSAASDMNALGLDEETALQPRVDVDWGNLHLAVSGLWVDYTGDGAVRGTLELGGNIIPAGTPARTDLEMDFYTGYITYDLLPIDFLFDLGVGLGVGYLDYDLAIQSKTSPARISSDEDLPFGFLTARVAREIGRFEIVGMVSGLGVEFDDADISYYEVDAFAGFRLFGEGRIQGNLIAGYRAIGLDCEWDDQGRNLDADVDFQGPYIGFKLRF